MQNQSSAFFMLSMLNHDLADEDNCNCTDSRDHKIKMYKLWHWCFAHLDSVKLCDLHKIMTLSKSILIVKKKDHVCKVCACYDQAQRRTSWYERCTESVYSVWHTDMMLNKVCNSAETLSAHQHKSVSDIQDIFYFYIGRSDFSMGLIMFNF